MILSALRLLPLILALLLTTLVLCAPTSAQRGTPVAVVLAAEADAQEELGAREVRRYGYLRTGNLLPIVRCTTPGKMPADLPSGAAIIVGNRDRALVRALLNDALPSDRDTDLGPQDHLLTPVESGGRELLVLTGGSSTGTLYAAYQFVELLGVRFYLHGDTIPDGRCDWPRIEAPLVNRPLFDLRGIHPFHDFPEGPDWWNLDDYKAVLAQLPKLRMNFFGLHCYPEGRVGPEPTVWIGTPDDVGPDGEVSFAYPSRHFTTHTDQWGYQSRDTDDYDFGADTLFARAAYGSDTMRGVDALPRTAAESAQLFESFGALLADAFSFARTLGIRTCIGTEAPLTIPALVRERLQAAGEDPDDPAVVRRLYEGLFIRIARTHPLDYYWLWTPEGWTWSGASAEDAERTVADLQAAMDAAERIDAPFQLATCGWVLGPPGDRTLFDRMLPEDAPLSCINRNVGFAPVEPGFAAIEGRPKWAIPWLEDDPAMILPQLWVGRMRRDAADALAYGCTGLMGIHWRTRILAPNVAALAHAGWDQSGWNPDLGTRLKTPDPARTEGTLGGRAAAFPGQLFAETEEHELYQSVLYDLDGVRLEVPGEVERLTLEFCEPHYREAGKRVFGVTLGGRTVVERLDVFEEVGGDCTHRLTFADVPTTDGILHIGFTRIVEFPCIAGIVIEGDGWTRRINLGGPELPGREACPSRRPYAAWPAGKSRDAPSDDFYLDWARAEFGAQPAAAIAEIFTSLDGGPEAFSEGLRNTSLPRPSTWMGGPGGVRSDPRPWESVRGEYAFVDELAALRSRVQGEGNLERFDYWLDNFRYLRAVGRVSCLRSALESALQQASAAQGTEAQTQLARDRALPLRVELVAAVAEVYRHLLATVSTRGGMGTVANWQQHVAPSLLTEPGGRLRELLGEPLPAEAVPGTTYEGPARVFLPTVRTSVTRGEPLELEVIVLGAVVERAVLRWARMGDEQFRELQLTPVARGVFTVTLPGEATTTDLEYYVEVRTSANATLHFPATAPERNQTVVILTEDAE